MQYFSKNLIHCKIISRNPQCLQWIRDVYLMGRKPRKIVKVVISYCQLLHNQSSLQDPISNFCGEMLYPLAPARKSAQELIQYLTLNLTLGSQLLLSESRQRILPHSEETDFSLSAGIILTGITFVVAALAIIGRKQCRKLVGFFQERGKWLLWDCRYQQPNQDKVKTSISRTSEIGSGHRGS